ncbi:protein Ecm30p [Monosporozyma servazzii]
MGNTDSKLNPVYKHHLNLLLSKDSINLFQGNITRQQIYDLLYLKWDNINNINILSNIQSIFNPFYTDLLINNNNTTIINKSVLQKIFEQNITNYENLLRFVIINFILHSKYIQLNQSIDSVNIQTTLTNCINLLINLLPIYYSSSSHSNKKTDFIWNCHNLNVVFNTDINFPTSIDSNDTVSTPPISLGQLIIDNLLSLSFINGWTVYFKDTTSNNLQNVVWENGIGTKDNFSLKQYPHLDSNRLLCLKLWLTLFSNELYSNNNNNNNNNNNLFLTNFILTKSNNKIFKRLFLSIINITSVFGNNFKSNLTKNNYYKDTTQSNQLKNLDDNIITDNKLLIQLKSKLIFTGIQFINTILSNPKINNQDSLLIKDFISSLFTNEFDLKLFLSSFTKIFKYPIDKCIETELNPLNFNKSLNSSTSDSSISNNNNNNNNHSQNNHSQNDPTQNNHSQNNNISTLPDIPDILIQLLLLIKSMLQFNNRFKLYFIDKFGNKFVIFNIYYIKYYSRFSKYKSNLIPLCFVLTLLILNDKVTHLKLLQSFSINYYTNKLPNFFKLSNLELNNINSLTYRDFIIIHLSNWNIKLIKQNLIPNNFTFEIIYNILSINTPINNNINNDTKSNAILSYNAALALLNLFAKMSNKAYLSSFGNNELHINGSQYLKSIQSLSLPSWKLDQLALMIRAILTFILFHYNESKNLIFLLTRHQNLFFQIKDSLTFISKIIFNNPTKLNDYMFHDLQNIQTFTKIEYMIQLNQHELINNNNNNSNNNMSNEKMGCCNPANNNDSSSTFSNDSNESFMTNNQTLIFNKTAPVSLDNETETSTNTNNTTNENINTTNKSKTINNDENKNVKKKLNIWEHSDHNHDLFSHDQYIYTNFKRKWPLGLNENHKLKLLQNLTIDPTNNTYWTGYQDFKLLTKLIKLFIVEFPEIPNTKNNSEFTILLKKFDVFKPKFDEKIKNQLPIHLTNMSFSDGIQICINDVVFQEWVYKLCWTDIFNAHSYPYQYQSDAIDDSTVNKQVIKPTETTPQNKRLSDVASMENTNNNSSNRTSVSSSPLLPSLERWSSTNSNLSRTQSNSSSILNFFSPDSINSDNDTIASNNNTPKHQTSTSASSSSGLFKFSWSNFHKGDEEAASVIKEEIDDNDDEIQDNNSKKINFPIDLYKIPSDERMIKDNIWVDTNIKLFRLKKEEKEEVSFLDMTSSLLKKFKFSNVIDTSYDDDASYVSSNNEPLSRPIRRYF